MRQYGVLIAIAAAAPLLAQLAFHGRPASLWLLGAVGVAAAAHFKRPPGVSFRRIFLTSLRNAAVSAAVGLASVLTIQLTLHYVAQGHAALARTWTLRIGEAREWVEGITLLGPKKLAVLLVFLIAVAAIAPSLRVIRNYRRVTSVASHCLLALVVATSFVFFGNSYSRAAEWIARLSAARENVAAIDKSYAEVVKAAAIERSLARIPLVMRARLVELGMEIEKHPQRAEIRKRLAEELVTSTFREVLTHQSEAARQRVEQSKPSDEQRRSQERIEYARQQSAKGEALSPDELAALKIERTRAEALAQESGAALRQFFTQTLLPPIIGEMLQTMYGAAGIRGRVRPTDRATAASAVAHDSAEPPRLSFDHVLGRPPDRHNMDWAINIPILVQITGKDLVAERRAAEEKRRASKSGRSYGGGGGGRGTGGTSQSSGGSRFGVRGGGPLLVA